MTRACVDVSGLLQFIEGDVSQLRAREIAAHLEGCAHCTAQIGSLRSTIDALATDSEEHEGLDLVPSIHRAIAQGGRPPARSGRPHLSRRPVVVAVMSLAAAAALVVAVLPREGDEFRRKGNVAGASTAAGAGIKPYVVRGSEAAPLANRLSPEDALLFAYSNSGEAAFSYLMIFALDERGEVFWYYPAYTDAMTDPAAISITAGASEVILPEHVRQSLQRGALVIYGLFSHTPVRVSTIEAWAKELVANGAWQARSPAVPPLAGTYADLVPAQVQ
jgi:hypothetical protein